LHRQGLLDPVIELVERPACHRPRPQSPADEPLALEDERRRAQRGGVVDDTRSADAVAGDHIDACALHVVDEARVGAELQVVGEVLGLQPRPAFEEHDLGAAGREMKAGDRAARSRADDDDVGGFAHRGLPVDVVCGCDRASLRR
jgi:hypothetical protein